MLSLHAIDQTEDYLSDGESYMLGSNNSKRYNYAVALLKKQQDLERLPSKLNFIPHRLLLLSYLSYYARFLMIASLVLTSVIPFFNILTCIALLFFCIVYCLTMKTLEENKDLGPNLFNNMIEYNELCVSSQGNQLPSQYFMIDMQIFERESRDVVEIIRENLGIRFGDEQIFLIAYRNCVRSWFQNQQVLDQYLIICLVLGFLISVAVTAGINLVVIKSG